MRLTSPRLALAATWAVILATLFAPSASAQPPTSQEVSFSVSSLSPSYAPGVFDYVVRCNNGPVTIDVHASGGWQVAIDSGPFQSGDFSEVVPLSAGQEFTVTAESDAGGDPSRYYVRCLPDDFPAYAFTRTGPVSPAFFSVDQAGSTPIDHRYSMIFDKDGVPIWWYHTPAHATRVLPGGNVLWFDDTSSLFEIHRLNGSLVRTLDAVGQPADPHDLQLLPNGGYLAGAYVTQKHVDTSAYGGSSDARVINAELQQVGQQGRLAWDWKSQDHISLAETGQRWPWVTHHTRKMGYDILHWNSIEPDGNSVIASFRHLDAVYKIRKDTGEIAWKLGGRKTGKSLTVKQGDRTPTFGAQHDARLLPDGTLTVFDNRTNVSPKAPRAERFRIDQNAGTATLVQSISDPSVTHSNCCGSARRLGNGDWLIDWGQDNPIAGYRASGARTFLLSFASGYSYRAEPVPEGATAAQDLRDAMNAIFPPAG
jgi:arylsulfotransferase ASST